MSKLARMKAGAVAIVIGISMLASAVPSFASVGNDMLFGDARSDWEAEQARMAEYQKQQNELDKQIAQEAANDPDYSSQSKYPDLALSMPEIIKAAIAKTTPVYYGKYKVPMQDYKQGAGLVSSYNEGLTQLRQPIIVPVTTYKSGYQNGFISGYPDGTFKPNAKVTRAEFLSMLAAIIEKNPKLELQESYNSIVYSDLTTPYYKVGWWKPILSDNALYKGSIIDPVMELNPGEYYNEKEYFGYMLSDSADSLNSRYGNKTFKEFVLSDLKKDYDINKGIVSYMNTSERSVVTPDAEASREYIAYVLNSVLDLSEYSDHSTALKDDILKYYKGDVRKYTVYESMLGANHELTAIRANGATEAVMRVYNAGIMVGSDGYFRPKDSVTRAEIVTILNRIFYSDVKTPSGKQMKFNDINSNAWYYTDVLKACKE